MKEFFRRTLTGAWIVIFVMGGIWLHPLSFVLTGMIMLVGTQYEYFQMIRKSGVKPQIVSGIIAGVSVYIISTFIAAGFFTPSWFLILIPFILIIMGAELYRKNDRPFDSIAHTIFSLLYTVMPFSMFPFLTFSHEGLDSLLPHSGIIFSPGVIIGFFMLIWANDSGAYLAGASFGRHRLFERISPKKSWEGFFGGLLLALLVAWLLSGWFGVVDRIHWVIISVIISISGTYGDLIESLFKRSVGVKDTGTIMPGHGGFLDRFDSTIFAFPLVYLFILLFG